METSLYTLQIFATDIRTQSDLLKVSPALNENIDIYRWNIDQEDKDCVLRVESTLTANQIIELIISHKFDCTELE